MSDETTLRECPFCGSEYTQVRWIGFKDKSNGAFESGFRGECTECFALTRAFNTESEAIAAWNTRDELKVRISELEKQWDARDSDCIALEGKVNRLEDEITDWSKLYTQVLSERNHVIAERNELKAKVAELVEKLDSFEGEAYCGGTVVDWYEMATRLQAQVDEMHETHMRLPVDADGAPILIGDLLSSSETGETFMCRGFAVCLRNETEKWWTVECSYDEYSGTSEYVSALSCRHVKPETVEGLLEEFGAMFEAETDDIMPLVRDYAERIRKAVDNECQ